MFDLHTNIENDRMIIYLQGSLDLNGVEILETKISEVDFASIHKIYIDFAEVDFIDSTGIGSMVHMFRSFEEHGLDYYTIHVSDDIYDIFTIVGLEDLFKIS